MKLHFFSLLLLTGYLGTFFLAVIFLSFFSLTAESALKKYLLKDACVKFIFSDKRPSVRQRMAERWGIKKKLDRWQKVIDSAHKAVKYIIDSATVAREEQYLVRVLLFEHALEKGHCVWELLSPGGFIIIDDTAQQTGCLLKKPSLVVTYKKGAFYMNGMRFESDAVRIISEQGTTKFDGVTYRGDFLFVRYRDRILCINCIELESYVGSVLSSESWPGWPLEVNKAFAVMCRSYVLSHMLAAQKSGRPYHVRNTNSHQNYHGVHTSTVIEEAVAQTAGMCLVYNNKPILAMFDACCGGVIPAHIAHGIDFKKEPYLARAYACTYCKKYSLYNWEKTFSLAELEKKFRAAQLCNDAVHEVRVVARDKAGLAKTVHIKTKRGVVTCKGKQIYSALAEVKSYAFDVIKSGHAVTITGYGHGHHLGVCQWGAREMVRLGYSYQQILSFYYPGTQLRAMA